MILFLFNLYYIYRFKKKELKFNNFEYKLINYCKNCLDLNKNFSIKPPNEDPCIKCFYLN